jgi:hypothetical protein
VSGKVPHASARKQDRDALRQPSLRLVFRIASHRIPGRESHAMDRFESAFEKLSSARRHLIAIREEGDEGSFRGALADVQQGLELLGDAVLHSDAARHSVSVLRQALGDPSPDRLRTMEAIDDLASLLYWTETSLSY